MELARAVHPKEGTENPSGVPRRRKAIRHRFAVIRLVESLNPSVPHPEFGIRS